MRRIDAREGRAIEGLSVLEEDSIRRKLLELQDEMRPRIPFIAPGGVLRLQNLVGSVQVTEDLVLEVNPKTRPDGSWATAIVDLLSPSSKASLGVHQKMSSATRFRDLPDAFAKEYASRLEYGLRRDGPLSAHVRTELVSPRLGGKLKLSSWLKSRITSPGAFPQERSTISLDNRFSNALAWTAEYLARMTEDYSVASKLRSIAVAIRPGEARVIKPVDSSVVLATLPDQWRGYSDAWDIVKMVIKKSSPLSRDSRGSGFDLAIEPWPLLESLASRIAQALAADYSQDGPPGFEGLGYSGKYRARKLNSEATSTNSPPFKDGYVIPDAMLRFHGSPIVTFESKYSAVSHSKLRLHSFQALTTGAVLEVPVAVLIYPGSFGPVVWDVQGFYGGMRTLIAFGVDMYSYRHGGEVALAERLRAAIDGAGCSPLRGLERERDSPVG